MDTLLMVAVVLIALAIIVQAGVLLGMYRLSRKLTDGVEALMTESQTLMAPLEAISSNLKTTSEDLSAVGKMVRSESETLRNEIADVKERIISGVGEARETVMKPVREWSAIAQGIAVGLRVLFGRTSPVPEEKTEHPAA